MPFAREAIMKRREFITLLGGAAAAWPLAVHAQDPDRMRRIGVLIANYAQTDREGQANIAAFVDAFQRLGWINGRNVRIEYRWSAGDPERAKVAAADLVRLGPDVIVVTTSPALAELQRLTNTIPIVFSQVGDPVESGFVASLARPGGNITGFQAFEPAMGGKWLGVLKEAQPDLRRAAVLFESGASANVAYKRAAEAIAPSLGMTVTAVDVLDAGGIDNPITAFAGSADGGLLVIPNRYTLANRGAIIVLAARHRLPAIYPYRYFANEGGLISYGFDQIEQWRGVASYVDRILRGEKPGALPIQAPTKFELVINMNTAKALGLSIPPAFPLRADEVIE
jgi:ABC-type uncharacterized transport system substrate-binding protein